LSWQISPSPRPPPVVLELLPVVEPVSVSPLELLAAVLLPVSRPVVPVLVLVPVPVLAMVVETSPMVSIVVAPVVVGAPVLPVLVGSPLVPAPVLAVVVVVPSSLVQAASRATSARTGTR
jgi:hypothetical protein